MGGVDIAETSDYREEVRHNVERSNFAVLQADAKMRRQEASDALASAVRLGKHAAGVSQEASDAVKRIEGYLRYFLTSLGATVSEPDSFETFDVLQKTLDEATAAGVQDA